MPRQTEGNVPKWLIELLLKEYDDDAPIATLSAEIEAAVPEGENFCSNVFRVEAKGSRVSGKEIHIKAICKKAPEGEITGGILEMFQNEMMMYSTVFPLMNTLMEELKDERERLWCKFLGHLDGCALVFEDLTELSFSPYRRTDWLSDTESTLILQELGRFHAMSRVLIGRESVRKGDFSRNNLHSDSDVWGKLFTGPLILLAEEIMESWGVDWKTMADLIKLQVKFVCERMTQLIEFYDDRFEVINHGDLWSCNIMRGNKDPGNEAFSIRFIDFQQPCINSFITDVTMFLHTSVDPSIRRNRIDSFLKSYATSLRENLQFYRWSGYMPTLEDVESEYKRTAYLAFVFSTTFFPMTTSTTSQPFQMDKIEESPAEQIFDKSAFADERIVRELKEDLNMFAAAGVLSQQT